MLKESIPDTKRQSDYDRILAASMDIYGPSIVKKKSRRIYDDTSRNSSRDEVAGHHPAVRRLWCSLETAVAPVVHRSPT